MYLNDADPGISRSLPRPPPPGPRRVCVCARAPLSSSCSALARHRRAGACGHGKVAGEACVCVCVCVRVRVRVCVRVHACARAASPGSRLAPCELALCKLFLRAFCAVFARLCKPPRRPGSTPGGTSRCRGRLHFVAQRWRRGRDQAALVPCAPPNPINTKRSQNSSRKRRRRCGECSARGRHARAYVLVRVSAAGQPSVH